MSYVETQGQLPNRGGDGNTDCSANMVASAVKHESMVRPNRTKIALKGSEFTSTPCPSNFSSQTGTQIEVSTPIGTQMVPKHILRLYFDIGVLLKHKCCLPQGTPTYWQRL